jgi:hypothetical protein
MIHNFKNAPKIMDCENITQFAAYFVFSLPYLYHSCQTFQFISICAFEEWAFVLKPQVALNELKPNSIDIMCSSIIDKYINRHSQYESLSLVKFGYLYNIFKKNQNIANPKLLSL